MKRKSETEMDGKVFLYMQMGCPPPRLCLQILSSPYFVCRPNSAQVNTGVLHRYPGKRDVILVQVVEHVDEDEEVGPASSGGATSQKLQPGDSMAVQGSPFRTKGGSVITMAGITMLQHNISDVTGSWSPCIVFVYHGY